MKTKIAVVTGATGGMGMEIVADLAVDHTVYALGRNGEQLSTLAGISGVVAVESDIVKDVLGGGGVDKLKNLDRVDTLVHAAAVARNSTVEAGSVAEWRAHMDLNVIVPAELTRQLLPALRAASGHVVFINSGAGNGPHPGNTIYAASKHALRGLADAFRKEEANGGVRVTTVSPGPTDTPMLRGLMDADGKGGNDYDPAKYIEPVEVAKAIRFVIDAGDTTQITNVDVRPRVELADRTK
ncbi:short chain dehydrogenase [Corynebacterium deserti GIMN1.010]|uniref:Short chain dehydrogenase n=1 Tax=Corynebacterium deserti GIMN1.010 TaxID=931089 RepID=A0A0M4CF10_9CORY|nr:SDR family oxidoreductase [Corynebacterium deserti]ALC06591.1 short chain dehydrogenase [Corynebacterium deserti GIMN1.010]